MYHIWLKNIFKYYVKIIIYIKICRWFVVVFYIFFLKHTASIIYSKYCLSIAFYLYFQYAFIFLLLTDRLLHIWLKMSFFSAQQAFAEEPVAAEERAAGGDIGEEMRLFILSFIIWKENNTTKHNVGLYSCKDYNLYWNWQMVWCSILFIFS